MSLTAVVEDKRIENPDGVADRLVCNIRIYDGETVVRSEPFSILLHQRPLDQAKIQNLLDMRKNQLLQSEENASVLDLDALT